MSQLNGQGNVRAIVAGKGELEQPIPKNVEVRNRLIGDAEAIDLFSRCSLVVLPYRDATQSALIGAAYFFGKPVVVTRTGALPEYVNDGITGWIIEPGNAAALAECLSVTARDPARLQQMGRAGHIWYDKHYQDENSILRRMYKHVAHA